ncbi:MAG: ParB/RepB/Spo0J family partition protein [Lachnospiraceae bacterium]|nr:ParB/RepB/Spo0J family partition protein [Lachnospiraceae bacterium]
MAQRKALNRGLDSLIPPKKGKESGSEKLAAEDRTMMGINKIEPNREQPRKHFDEDALEELADSIKQFGVLEPLLVCKRDNYYMIVAGERRWRAAKKVGLKEVPVVIRNDLTEREIVEIQLIENIQRKDLNAIEEAQAYERLIKEFNMKQDEVAERVSKSRVYITNSMRLLKLSPEVQQMVIDEMLTTGHARALIPVENPEEQYRLAQRIFDERLSVRDAEKIVKQLDTPGKIRRQQKKNEALEAIYKDLAERLKQTLGTRVEIISKGSGNGGKMEIEFYSGDDLERISGKLLA